MVALALQVEPDELRVLRVVVGDEDTGRHAINPDPPPTADQPRIVKNR
jgi:hypothetical protein